jgi:hypothetical protein
VHNVTLYQDAAHQMLVWDFDLPDGVCTTSCDINLDPPTCPPGSVWSGWAAHDPSGYTETACWCLKACTVATGTCRTADDYVCCSNNDPTTLYRCVPKDDSNNVHSFEGIGYENCTAN